MTYCNTRCLSVAALLALTLPLIADDNTAPAVPAELQPPSGNRPFLMAQASGTQNYICLPSATGVAWSFVGPEATLFVGFRGVHGNTWQQVATHFLSHNPNGNGTPGPTWQAFDTSRIWGNKVASSTDPKFVAPGAIPWLLLQVVGSARGPAGGDLLSRATFIQRVNTGGGVAPPTGCSQATDVGSLMLVPYSAEYVFYAADR
jgi:hypothetical protein